MSRGDKRDRDRSKNQAKQLAKSKAQAKTGNPLDRNASDKAALEAKIAMKAAQKQAQEDGMLAGSQNKIVSSKKVGASGAGGKDLDDILNAGLSAMSGNKGRKKF
mmetsp:Transcript_2272/g.4203  ORF Transcript_2272/g.4203 Transcript_2272/m.4203 type:complete len:105 (+) Transcript_2272:494-808(+)